MVLLAGRTLEMERESMCKGGKCFKTGVLWWSIHATHDMKCFDNNLSSS